MRKPDIRVLIMAGGSGTRFWPLSRGRRPKQFLPIISARTMLEETVLRLRPFVPPGKVYTVANAAQTDIISRLAPEVPRPNRIVEPQGRNTAPSLVLATARLYLENPEAVVVVLPSDHLILNNPLYLRQLEAGCLAASEGETLVTFGIPPSFPATGYGYIKASAESAAKHLGFPFHRALAFKEKPSLEKARRFLRAGNYYWNSGMFIWRAGVFARKLEAHAQEFFACWQELVGALKKSPRAAAAVFAAIPALSIDYALMEKASGVFVCPARFGWSDVGAWSSLLDIWKRDEAGNAARGEAIFLDSRNSLVYNPDRLTAVIGLEDVIVVDTKDALLVCRRDRDQGVKDVLDILKKKGLRRYL